MHRGWPQLPNRNFFSWDLKCSKFMSRRRYGSKLFHLRGPVALKLRLPKLCIHGTRHVGCCLWSLLAVVTCWVTNDYHEMPVSCECPINMPVANRNICWHTLSGSQVLPQKCPFVINFTCRHVFMFCQWLFSCRYAYYLTAVLTA